MRVGDPPRRAQIPRSRGDLLHHRVTGTVWRTCSVAFTAPVAASAHSNGSALQTQLLRHDQGGHDGCGSLCGYNHHGGAGNVTTLLAGRSGTAASVLERAPPAVVPPTLERHQAVPCLSVQPAGRHCEPAHEVCRHLRTNTRNQVSKKALLLAPCHPTQGCITQLALTR